MHNLRPILYLLSAAFFYKYDERREQQPVLNLSGITVVATFVDLLSTNLDYFPEETFMLVSANKYLLEYEEPTCVTPFEYKPPSQFDLRNILLRSGFIINPPIGNILLQFLAVE